MKGKFLTVPMTLIATVGYLGLAIWDAGGFALFFSEPARIIVALAEELS